MVKAGVLLRKTIHKIYIFFSSRWPQKFSADETWYNNTVVSS